MSNWRILVFGVFIFVAAQNPNEVIATELDFPSRVFVEMQTSAPIGCENTANRMSGYLNIISAAASSSKENYLAIIDSMGIAVSAFPPEIHQHFLAVKASIGNSYQLLGHDAKALDCLRGGIAELKELSKSLDKYLDPTYQPAELPTQDQACLLQHDAGQTYFSAMIFLGLAEKLSDGENGHERSNDLLGYSEYLQNRMDLYGPALDAMGFERE